MYRVHLYYVHSRNIEQVHVSNAHNATDDDWQCLLLIALTDSFSSIFDFSQTWDFLQRV